MCSIHIKGSAYVSFSFILTWYLTLGLLFTSRVNSLSIDANFFSRKLFLLVSSFTLMLAPPPSFCLNLCFVPSLYCQHSTFHRTAIWSGNHHATIRTPMRLHMPPYLFPLPCMVADLAQPSTTTTTTL